MGRIGPLRTRGAPKEKEKKKDKGLGLTSLLARSASAYALVWSALWENSCVVGFKLNFIALKISLERV
jgi:hypothetical protein